MLGMVPDNDITGQFRVLRGHLESDAWIGLWGPLNITLYTFELLALPRNAPDRHVWNVCQQRQVILVTANRNDDDPDSLAATIRDSNTLQSLPVFTLTDPDRIGESSFYAEEVVVQMLDYLMYMDNLRGTGRIWLP